MKRFALMTCASFALAAAGCEDTQDANAKIHQCLEGEYGTDEADDLMLDWELTCDETDSACKECIDCVMGAECRPLLDGDCSTECDEAEDIFADENDTDDDGWF
jgi:hypothetical protein